MLALRLTLVLVLAQLVLPAQKPDTPLEVLLKRVDARLVVMTSRFDATLNEALRVFRSDRPAQQVEARQYVSDLVPWVGVFPERFAEVAIKEKNRGARTLMLEVIARSRDARVAPYLARALPEQPSAAQSEFAAAIVACLGELHQARLAPRLRNLMEHSPDGRLTAALLIALARLKHPDALKLASSHLADPKAAVRTAALRTLEIVGDSSKETAKLVLERARKEKDPKIHALAIRTLGIFPGRHQVLQFLHKTLQSDDNLALASALETLKTVGRKDLSARPLLQFIAREQKVPQNLRDGAARLLLSWGLLSGVKAVVQPQKELADANPKSRDLQQDLAERYRSLGAWREAIIYYKNALRQARSLKTSLHVGLARCHARMGKFGRAKRALLNAGYTDFTPFRDDADFAQMRLQRDYAPLFEPKK